MGIELCNNEVQYLIRQISMLRPFRNVIPDNNESPWRNKATLFSKATFEPERHFGSVQKFFHRKLRGAKSGEQQQILRAFPRVFMRRRRAGEAPFMFGPHKRQEVSPLVTARNGKPAATAFPIHYVRRRRRPKRR